LHLAALLLFSTGRISHFLFHIHYLIPPPHPHPHRRAKSAHISLHPGPFTPSFYPSPPPPPPISSLQLAKPPPAGRLSPLALEHYKYIDKHPFEMITRELHRWLSSGTIRKLHTVFDFLRFEEGGGGGGGMEGRGWKE